MSVASPIRTMGVHESRQVIGVLLMAVALTTGAARSQASPLDSGAEASALPSKEMWRSRLNCGPNCLFVVSSLMGYEFDYQLILDSIEMQPGGCSLRDLQAAAERMGASALVCRAALGEIEATDRPLVLHLEKIDDDDDAAGHFVVFAGKQGDEFLTIDGTTGVVTRMTKASLLDQWSGLALILRAPSGGYGMLWAAAVLGVISGLLTRVVLARRGGLAT